MTKLPANFAAYQNELVAVAASVEGYLSDREIKFLALLAAYPTARGEILEIGSFKGKSTIVLAKAAKLDATNKVYAVDPMIAPSETDPDLDGQESSLAAFEENIKKHDVADRIELHVMRSIDLAADWDLPIRLLWIDGDHTYTGTKIDYDGFAGHLADGAIVAIHDVLHEFEGGLRVFAEDILLSPHFGACGFVGSIAWSRFHKNPEKTVDERANKLDLYKRVSKLIPYVAFGNSLGGLEKKKFKLLRSRVPHGDIDHHSWIKMLDR